MLNATEKIMLPGKSPEEVRGHHSSVVSGDQKEADSTVEARRLCLGSVPCLGFTHLSGQLFQDGDPLPASRQPAAPRLPAHSSPSGSTHHHCCFNHISLFPNSTLYQVQDRNYGFQIVLPITPPAI